MDDARAVLTSGSDTRLLVLIARSEESFDPLVSALLDAGITGATVLESRGLANIIRMEMPIFAGLASLLPAPHPLRTRSQSGTYYPAQRSHPSRGIVGGSHGPANSVRLPDIRWHPR